MNETFELPIDTTEIPSVTECWTYNRLIIIKTSPYYRDWLASHFNLYVDTRLYNFLFGDISKHSPAYYDEILLRKPLRFFNLTRHNVVSSIKEQLKQGYYLILFIKPHREKEYIHEILIYGFDDENQHFLTIGLKNRQFQTIHIDYSHLEDTIEEVKAYFLNKNKQGMKLSLIYQYPFTAYKANPAYSPYNCAYEAYKKIINELNGKIIFKNSLFEITINDDRQYLQIYTGINCLVAFQQVLQNEIGGIPFNPWFDGVTAAAKKLLEHRKLVTLSINYLLKKWDKAITETAKIGIEEYKQCIVTAEKWLNMCLKYEYTQDKSLLKRIMNEVPGELEKEKNCLDAFVTRGIDWDRFNINYI